MTTATHRALRTSSLMVLLALAFGPEGRALGDDPPLYMPRIFEDTTLTTDVIGPIYIEADNITLDGAGHTVFNPYYEQEGIVLGGVYGNQNRTGVTIKNLTVTGFYQGINLTGINLTSRPTEKQRISLLDNTFTDNLLGVMLDTDHGHVLRGNRMFDNHWNFTVAYAFPPQRTRNVVDITNTVDGRPIVYLTDQAGVTVDASSNAGYVAAVHCRDIVVRDLELSGNGQGVFFAFTEDSLITNVTANRNVSGIAVTVSDRIGIAGNTLTDNYTGVSLAFDDDSLVWDNCITGGGLGIELTGSRGAAIAENLAVGGSIGIRMWDASSNDVAGNMASDCSNAGLELRRSDSNLLVDNTVTNSSVGIRLRTSDDNRIRENLLSGNGECIVELDSSGNRFLKNICDP